MSLLENNTRTRPEIISFQTIRRIIGYMGICLPFVLYALSKALGCEQMQPSISHYYYTMAGTLFTGTLCAVGLFLISYKGFGPLDDFSTNLAGVFAFGVAFLPTNLFEQSTCNIIPDYPVSTLRTTLHYASAALFFITLAFISFFLFTKSKGHKTKQKVNRNRVYRTCAILMIIFIALVPVCSATEIAAPIAHLNPTFWLEAFALTTFGISWLVKGEVVLHD